MHSVRIINPSGTHAYSAILINSCASTDYMRVLENFADLTSSFAETICFSDCEMRVSNYHFPCKCILVWI